MELRPPGSEERGRALCGQAASLGNADCGKRRCTYREQYIMPFDRPSEAGHVTVMDRGLLFNCMVPASESETESGASLHKVQLIRSYY